MQFFAVGGFVRDKHLGVDSKDVDFTVVIEDDDLKGNMVEDDLDLFLIVLRRLEAMGLKVFRDKTGMPVGAKFLTIRGDAPANFPFHPGRPLDFVLARKESGYTDGRHPDKVEPGTLMDDLARRDFTMNAMAEDTEGNLIDPFNGAGDLDAGIIRAVGDPMERLRDDALRAVRALRFSVTKGMRIDPDLKRAMRHPEILALVEKVSDERIGDPGSKDPGELTKMLHFDTLATLEALSHFPGLTEAMLSGNVSLTTSLKTKGRGK